MHYVLGDAGRRRPGRRARHHPAAARLPPRPGAGHLRLRPARPRPSAPTASSPPWPPHARIPPRAALAAWWPEHRCAAPVGTAARPDGYGRWPDQTGGDTDFFLEYDTGTETAARVAAKLPGYADARRGHRHHHPGPVLVPQLPAREAGVRPALAASRCPRRHRCARPRRPTRRAAVAPRRPGRPAARLPTWRSRTARGRALRPVRRPSRAGRQPALAGRRPRPAHAAPVQDGSG